MACRMHTHLYNKYVRIKNATTSNKYAAKVKRFPWPPMRMTTLSIRRNGGKNHNAIYMRQEPSFRNLEKVSTFLRNWNYRLIVGAYGWSLLNQS